MILTTLYQYFLGEEIPFISDSECNLKEVVKRDTLCDKIGIARKDLDSQKPILLHVYNQYTSGSKVNLKPTVTETTITPTPGKKQPSKPGSAPIAS